MNVISTNDIKASLKAHGYEVGADDDWLIENEIKKIIIDAKNKTNLNELPEEFEVFIIDMVVASILRIKLVDAFGSLNSNTDDDRVISSVSEGDTTIKYESSKSQDKSSNIHRVIKDYNSAYKQAIIRFRRIRW